MKTNIDLYKKVLTIVRKNGVGSLAPAEYLSWITMAQTAVVMAKLPFIDTNVRIKADLLPLYTTAPITLTPSGAGVYVGALPTDYLRMSGTALSLAKDSVTVYNVKLSVLNDNRRNEVLGSVYDRPSTLKCYYGFTNESGQKVKLYVPDGHTPTFSMSYYKSPVAITNVGITDNGTAQELVWDDAMMDEMAQRCASMYIESVEGQRFQSLNAEQNKNNNNQ
mgnify:CR=1 FL=1